MVELVVLSVVFMLTWYCVFSQIKLAFALRQIPVFNNAVLSFIAILHGALFTLLVYVFKFL